MRDLRYPHLHDNIGCPHCQFSLSELQLLVAKELIKSLWRPNLSIFPQMCTQTQTHTHFRKNSSNEILKTSPPNKHLLVETRLAEQLSETGRPLAAIRTVLRVHNLRTTVLKSFGEDVK